VEAVSGVLFFSKSPYRPSQPGQTVIDLPEQARTLDGGGPATDYAGLATVDCGGPLRAATVHTVDGDAP
jgi:hypothetical protein